MVVRPRAATSPSTVASNASSGGRTQAGVTPVTDWIAAWVASTCAPTCAAVNVVRSGWLQVWFSTGYPAANTARTSWGDEATCRPMSKKVAGAPYCSSTDSTAGVSGAGPSSKVSATTRRPAVAAPPGAWDVVKAGCPDVWARAAWASAARTDAAGAADADSAGSADKSGAMTNTPTVVCTRRVDLMPPL